jgi:hypothetical protein
VRQRESGAKAQSVINGMPSGPVIHEEDAERETHGCLDEVHRVHLADEVHQHSPDENWQLDERAPSCQQPECDEHAAAKVRDGDVVDQDEIAALPAHAPEDLLETISLVQEVKALVENKHAEKYSERVGKKVSVGVCPSVPIVDCFHASVF